jgi:pyridoxal 5'-phosphate synthase pdxT subunit
LTKVGVLAFQGDVREHLSTLSEIGVAGVPVKTLADLASVDGLILPGGESTTIAKLSRIFNLFDPIRDAIADGLPTFGTCAGLILLADEILDGIEGQETFGGLDVVVRRNAFGHQTESFEIDLEFEGVEGNPMTAAFIRAPIIEQVGPKARALATLPDGRVVAVRQQNLLGISFHPEVTGETRVHELFVREFIG